MPYQIAEDPHTGNPLPEPYTRWRVIDPKLGTVATIRHVIGRPPEVWDRDNVEPIGLMVHETGRPVLDRSRILEAFAEYLMEFYYRWVED